MCAGLFVVVSWISFVVPPDVIPGRKCFSIINIICIIIIFTIAINIIISVIIQNYFANDNGSWVKVSNRLMLDFEK